MPLGTRHVAVGRLRRGPSGLALDIDGGGTWQIDAGWWNLGARRLLGRRVRVEGVREGFDVLAAKRLIAAPDGD